MYSIFISHIHEEAALANLIGNALRKEFKTINIFNSSDRATLFPGNDIIASINQALAGCISAIFVVSPYSYKSKWINLEYGAVEMRNINPPKKASNVNTIPFCHCGMLPTNLGLPLNTKIGVVGTLAEDLAFMFAGIAKDLNWGYPLETSFIELAQEVGKFEDSYFANTEAKKCVQELHHVNLPVKNLKDTIDFYCDILELNLIKRAPFHFGGAWFGLPNGQHLHIVEQTDLELQKYKLPKKEKTKIPPDAHFALRVDKYDQYKSRITSKLKKRRYIDQPFGHISISQLYILDPNDYLIEITGITGEQKRPRYIKREDWERYAYPWLHLDK